MSQTGLNKMAIETNATLRLFGHGHGDTTYTKIFVGGLAWETKRDALKRYFEQFGEIIEAVVINDKITGKSKGYGFVTFKEANSAIRACYDPSPVIDGRRANCNLAAFGTQKNRPTSASTYEVEKFSPPPPRPRVMPPSTTGTPAFYRQLVPPYAFPYSAYRYPGYTQNIYPLNYYNVYGGQQFPLQYTPGTPGSPGSPGVYLSYFPLYPQYPKYQPFVTPQAASPSSVASTTGAPVEEVSSMQGGGASVQSDDHKCNARDFELQIRN